LKKTRRISMSLQQGPEATSTDESAVTSTKAIDPKVAAFKQMLHDRAKPATTDGLRHVKKEALTAFQNEISPPIIPVKEEVKPLGKFSTAQREAGFAQPLDAFQETFTEAPDNPTRPKDKVFKREAAKRTESDKYASQGSAQPLSVYVQERQLKDVDDLPAAVKALRDKAGITVESLSEELGRLNLQAPPVTEGPAPKPAGGLFSGWGAKAKPKSDYELQHEAMLANAKAIDAHLKTRQAYAATHNVEPDVARMLERRDQRLQAEFKAIDREHAGWVSGSRKAEIAQAKATLSPMLTAHLAAVRRAKPMEAEQRQITQQWHDSYDGTAYRQRKIKV
jgi:hypothetical protein